ncbi:MAG: tRNA (adenosine(37)-N6)-threonylcarbamoyltransferase complex ATPase subunit type 1 TsaE [Actinomycetota bacterium]|nr:tRNA (adenosine(37)-N6)-threonylcarbamoyltransferase complex ATPase subunit type 1 TsaE [Actinomycetota bacterium]
MRTRSVDGTRAVAAALVPLLQPGDVLLLSGDLGAGKTAFVQGLAAALGVTERVTSPTFTLAATYEGTMALHHLDVYRLDNLGEVLDLDLPDLLDDGGIVCIEWGEVVVPELPRDFLQIRLQLGHPEDIADARVLEFDPVGPSWRDREADIEGALSEWMEPNGC